MNKKNKFLKMGLLALCLSLLLGTNASASTTGTKASDTVSKTYSRSFSHTKKATSTDIGVAPEDIPAEYRNVSFDIVLTSAMQYDRITGRYVSSESPTVTLVYTGPVPLQLRNVSTSKKDNGSSVTFSYRADVTATVDTGFYIVTITYGSISNSFTVNK